MRKYLYLCQLIMEKLLHYTWKHRLYPLGTLATTDDKTVEVIDPGLHNMKDAGPDFFNAKIRVNGTEWVGNVELHLKASDWFRHGHDRDSAYDNVILHVVTEADMEVTTSSGRVVPQMVLTIPERLKTDYEHLLHQDKYPPCYERIPDIPKVKTHMFMSALQTERLERKTREIVKRMKDSRGSWEDAYFQTLARNFGFGINSEAFETWAMTIDLNKAAHHRDDLFQIEALFIGQAGLTAHLGTNNMREILERIQQGDEHAQLIVDAMIYHTAKQIAAEGAVLCGQIDAILLTGGMAHSDYIVNELRKRIDFLAPVYIFPGENEMQALALNALAVLQGKRKVNTYSN